jgi:hypothetical protein
MCSLCTSSCVSNPLGMVSVCWCIPRNIWSVQNWKVWDRDIQVCCRLPGHTHKMYAQLLRRIIEINWRQGRLTGRNSSISIEVRINWYPAGAQRDIQPGIQAEKITIVSEQVAHTCIPSDNMLTLISQQITHIEISYQITYTEISQQITHIEISQQIIHIEISQQITHIEISQQITHRGISQHITHIEISQQITHIEISQQKTCSLRYPSR